MRRLEHVDEAVDRAGRARAAEDHRVVVGVAADRVADDRRGRPRGSASSGGRCPDDSVWVFAYSGRTASRM